jgi:hypothetical protein
MGHGLGLPSYDNDLRGQHLLVHWLGNEGRVEITVFELLDTSYRA